MSAMNPYSRSWQSDTPLPQVAARAARQAIAAARRNHRLAVLRVTSRPKPLTLGQHVVRWAVMVLVAVTLVTVAVRTLLSGNRTMVPSSSLAASCLDLPSCLR